VGLRLSVEVGHRLLNLCDCDSILSERCRQTNSQDLKNNLIILLQSYLNLISVIACCKTMHNITQIKFKLLVKNDAIKNTHTYNSSPAALGYSSRLRRSELLAPAALGGARSIRYTVRLELAIVVPRALARCRFLTAYFVEIGNYAPFPYIFTH